MVSTGCVLLRLDLGFAPFPRGRFGKSLQQAAASSHGGSGYREAVVG